MTSDEVLWRARMWRADNQQACSHIERIILDEAAHQRRVSVQYAVEQVRKVDYSTISGDAFKINNSYRPVFARWMAEEHPEVKPYLETRRSRFDGVI